MARIIAISNQKGGVGKTTSAVSLAAQLALLGRKVLLVDFDPQGNATSGLGVEIPEQEDDLFEMFFGRATLGGIIRDTEIDGLKVAPSTRDLVGVEIELGKSPGRELILRSQLKLLHSSFDYIIIDCPPSLGLLTLNALAAAQDILIPLQSEYYALEGVSALLETIAFVRQTINPELSILGVFLTMFDGRTNLANQVREEACQHFGKLMFPTVIPRSVRLSEAPSHGLPISLYDPNSTGGRAYSALAQELDDRCFGCSDGESKVVVNA